MNAWKVFALVMIGLLIITAGIRFSYVEAHGFRLNEEDKSFAKRSAQEGLKDETGINNYNVTIPDYGRIISTANGDKKVVHVVFTNGNITLAVQIDMDTGAVLEKSRVEYSGWMTEHQGAQRMGHRGWFR